MIPLYITQTVRERIAPDATDAEANAAVLADLADGWTLMPRAQHHRRRRPGGGAFVQLAGRRYSFVARLSGYELPEGWCICPPRMECHCRAADGGNGANGADRNGHLEVRLIYATELSPPERAVALHGDRYDDEFVLVQGPPDVNGRTDPWLRSNLDARWTHVQRRVRRRDDGNATVELWDAVVQLRKRVAEWRAAPVRFETVEVVDEEDADTLLAFELSDGDAAVTQGAVYQLPGQDDLRLTVVELEDGVLLCEPNDTHPADVRDVADELRGARRMLVLDQDATSSVLRREQHVMRDYFAQLARNPLLYAVLAEPAVAREDPDLPLDVRPFQEELDGMQEAAVQQALRARDVLLVQGPPGTGKTTFIAELVLRHLRQYPGDTVLMASQTHHATDHLLRRVHRLDPDLPLVRIASPRLLEKKVARDVADFWLDAPRPWVPGVRARAEHYARFAQAQVAAGAWDARRTRELLAIQREYLGTDGVQKSREQRLRDARLVAGTCFGVSNDRMVREGTYGLAIVEEAGKASPPEALMAMLPAEKIVLVGDSRQLPPTPDRALDQTLRQARRAPEEIDDRMVRKEAVALADELEEARGLIDPRERPDPFTAETLFAHLGRRLRAERPSLEVTLTRQYRMVSGIGDLISHCFYDGDLRNGRREDRRDPRADAMTPAHVMLVDVDGSERERGRDQRTGTASRSKLNLKEADRAVRMLAKLESAAAGLPEVDDGRRLSVAVITGYMAQMRELRGRIDPSALPHLDVRVGIVDSFQGDEAEVVIVSLVRTAEPGFMRKRNRINVALSRARSLVIVLTALPQARAGTLGAPLRDVVAYVDDRRDEDDPRFVIDTWRKEGRR